MTSIRSLLTAVVVASSISSAYANVFFKGKPVHGGTTANCPVDVMRLMWGSDDMGTGDRIQGQIQFNKDAYDVSPLRIIVQGIDNSGELLESFAIKLYPIGMGGSFKAGFSQRNSNYKYDSNEWFYCDFPHNPEIKNFLVVNIVLNEKEVSYNLRLVGNRLPRSLSALPNVRKGYSYSTCGEFAVATGWVPPPAPKAESEFVKKPSKTQQVLKGAANYSTVIQRKEDETAGVTTYTVPVDWSFAMNGATFSLVPSVLESEDKPKEMTFLLAGNSTVRLGYSMRLEKILFFDPETKNRCTIEKESSDNWPSFYLSSARKEVSLKVTDECVRFLSEAAAIRCRFSFGTSDMPSAKNYDFAFSMQQVSALRALAQKCLGKND